MRECPDSDALLSVAQVLEWNPVEAVSHIDGCPECRRSLGELARLRELLTDPRREPSATHARTVSSLDARRERERARARLWTGAQVLVSGLLGAGALSMWVQSAALEVPLSRTGAADLVCLGAGLVLAVAWKRFGRTEERECAVE